MEYLADASRGLTNPAGSDSGLARREFIRFVATSPILGCMGALTLGAQAETSRLKPGLVKAVNLFDFEPMARQNLRKEIYDFVADGADDRKTLEANRRAFDEVQIRARRLIDVSRIDTSLKLFGQTQPTPVLLAPIGSQGSMHEQGEIAAARAAAGRKQIFIAPTLSTYSIGAIAENGGEVWFQLYPTTHRPVTLHLLRQAERAGCPVVVLTVDTPVVGNRESQTEFLTRLLGNTRELGNFKGVSADYQLTDPSLDWDFVQWLRQNTSMRIVLKGIVTAEDARLSLQHRVDGVIVSNHGGRQEESNRATLSCLPEVVEVLKGRMPVLIDGGFRRGTDVFKALALGADAVCIGRPYVWGLAALGQSGVEQVLDILQAELIRIMRLAGTPSLDKIGPRSIHVPGLQEKSLGQG